VTGDLAEIAFERPRFGTLVLGLAVSGA